MPFPESKQSNWFGLISVILVLIAELALIHVSRHAIGIECDTRSFGFCDVARNVLLASYGLVGALVLLALYDLDAITDLVSDAGLSLSGVAMNVIGLVGLFITLPFVQADLTGMQTALMAGVWVISICLVAAGVARMLAPWTLWRAFGRRLGLVAALVAIAGAAAPFLALRLRDFMEKDFLTDATFNVAIYVLQSIGSPIEIRPGTKIIGAGDFFVNVAPACSGVEGLVLTTVFASIYMALFYKDLKFPNVLVLLPIALVLSWTLNIVRITVLFQFGISGFAGLALGAFHSHAGWLMFTLLSLGIVLAAHYVPFFRETPGEEAPAQPVVPFFSDPVVAQIFPFAIFMASALLASTFSETPALVYPLRVLAMGAALLAFLPYLRTLPWRIDPLSLGAGVAIAGLWIATSTDTGATPPFAELGLGLTVIWIIARCVGTSICVPIIEELFFRGYLMRLISPDFAVRWRLGLSVLITSGLFALLHDRWIEAGIAGVIFALLAARSRNITDAIISHALANALIAIWALSTGSWDMI